MGRIAPKEVSGLESFPDHPGDRLTAMVIENLGETMGLVGEGGELVLDIREKKIELF